MNWFNNELIIKISKLKELGIYDFLHINQPVIVRRREGGEKILLNSKFHQKLKKIPLNQIKSMIETFSIKEEKFVNEIYYIKLNVSFNKKIIFKFIISI